MIESNEKEILDRVWRKLHTTFIDCPDCEGMSDDPEYTCAECWCVGGDGAFSLSSLIKQFELVDDIK